jgi:hypothetical protein
MPGGKLAEFDNLPLKAMIEAVCSEVAQDIVLDQGDLLIVSNHAALHRRSECTLRSLNIHSHLVRWLQ